jgi:rhamnulokinase
LTWLEDLTGSELKTIHIVGGGVNNKLLCQMAADACNRRVAAGPAEATALGNVLVQAVASGQLDSIAQARGVVRNSFEVDEYTPQEPGPWDEAFARFQSLRI